MGNQREVFEQGEQVTVQGYDFSKDGEVVDKTRGAATKVEFDDGTTMLIANQIITRRGT